MEKKGLLTFVLILIASYFIAFLILWIEIRKKDGVDTIKQIEKQNLSFQKKIDSLYLVNKNITIQISGMSNHIDTLKKRDEQYKKLYDENESEINKLKKKVSDLSRIDNFTSDDIKKYFSNLPK
jgi:chromosome segregation ATPase